MDTLDTERRVSLYGTLALWYDHLVSILYQTNAVFCFLFPFFSPLTPLALAGLLFSLKLDLFELFGFVLQQDSKFLQETIINTNYITKGLHLRDKNVVSCNIFVQICIRFFKFGMFLNWGLIPGADSLSIFSEHVIPSSPRLIINCLVLKMLPWDFSSFWTGVLLLHFTCIGYKRQVFLL